MTVATNMLGIILGRLTVIERVKSLNGIAYWKVKCRCGNIREVSGDNLRQGKKKHLKHNCGNCRDKEKYPKEYAAWTNMAYRCDNPDAEHYKDYGGRGITVYHQWRLEFLDFLDHIGPCPEASLSLDRIDVDGNYEPGNVRWASSFVQNNNKRSHKKENSTNA